MAFVSNKPNLKSFKAFRSSFNYINMLSLDAPLKLAAFSGTRHTHFSSWLKKYKDYVEKGQKIDIGT